jgi:hypothetical protein
MMLLLTSSLQAVEYDHAVDFSQYRTWSWQAGVPVPPEPVPDRRIREAVARELAARGLAKVERDPALLVRYHAARSTRIELLPLDSGSAAPLTGVRYVETGSLVVDLLDAVSGRVVWRGHATGALRYGPKEIAAQIDAAVAELMSRFPPGRGGGDAGPESGESRRPAKQGPLAERTRLSAPGLSEAAR